MTENTGKKDFNIAFRATEEYRQMLQEQALKRRIKVQQLIEEAIACYLSEGEEPKPAAESRGISAKDAALVARFLDFWHHPHDRMDKGFRDALEGIFELREKKVPKPGENGG